MKEKYNKLHKIELAGDDFKSKGLRIRVVKLYYDEKNYTCLTIEQLKKILELWIIGEEERYPIEKGFNGRWLLFDEIKKVFFNNDLIKKPIKTKDVFNMNKKEREDFRKVFFRK